MSPARGLAVAASRRDAAAATGCTRRDGRPGPVQGERRSDGGADCPGRVQVTATVTAGPASPGYVRAGLTARPGGLARGAPVRRARGRAGTGSAAWRAG